MVHLGALDRGSPSEGQDPTEKPSTDDIRDFWRHHNSTKWRSLLPEFGPWRIAVQLFIQWSKLGVWQRLFEKAEDRDQALGTLFRDATLIRPL
ncbi:hypothetical protein MSKU15_1941 [Komagataeibacter diospyri]|nr:hypothetical protein MSKU15_1941 [Komagataeibacter diospyri]